MKEEMGGTCSMHGRDREPAKKRPLRISGVNGKTILTLKILVM